METETARQKNISKQRPDFYGNIGIMQGRLSHSPQNTLQYFPQDSWENEFFLAREVGLSHIEVIAEEDFNGDNPLWSHIGRKRINDLKRESGVNVISACNNFTIGHSILQQKTIQNTIRFIKAVREIGVEKVVLPLLEASEPTSANLKDFITPLRTVADIAADCSVQLCCETSMDGRSLESFLSDLKHENIAVCYDVGNCTYFGHNLEKDMVSLNHWIQHIHFKDRNSQGHNVMLGTGLVNFPKVFKTLDAIGFTGTYTLETPRGSNPAETARKNLDHLQHVHINSAYQAKTMEREAG